MKKTTYIIVLLFLSSTLQIVTAQNSGYDTDMINLANQAVNRVNQKNKLVVAVWFFHNTKGEKTEIGDYVGRDFSVHFTNVEKNFEVVDRDHIEQLSAEHQWNEEGFIDPATAKQVNKLVAADAIVTGTVDYTLHHLRVRIKIIDTETGKQIGAAIKTIRLDESLKFILNDEYNNRKVTTPEEERIIIVEDENDPRTTNEDCERLKTGDYCFDNRTNRDMFIDVFQYKPNVAVNIAFRELRIKSGQNACMFNISAKPYFFRGGRNIMSREIVGDIKVEKCKSLTYVISDKKIENSRNQKSKPRNTRKPKTFRETVNKIFDIHEDIKGIIPKKKQKNKKD
ncbi:FlgO family outer membrane protein [Kordia sp.]|uniref:FlgO family outer membrane protein n=1 Tax=Kordia sp. TaxID=1965332 RepID=UPI003B5A38AD